MGTINYTTAQINGLLGKVNELPETVLGGDTVIPSKTSELENDSNFTSSSDFKTINGQSIVGSGNIQIDSGGGGGESGGNIFATNASEIKSGKKYTLSPIGDGSTSVALNELVMASDSRDGLLSSKDYQLLRHTPQITHLPYAVLSLQDTSTDSDITEAFAMTGEEIAYFTHALYVTRQEGAEEDNTRLAVGNVDCHADATYEDNTASLSLSYILAGVIHTIKISVLINGETYICSCSVTDTTADNVYYIPAEIRNGGNNTSTENWLSYFGGSDGFSSFVDAVNSNKEIRIKQINSTVYYQNEPVSYRSMMATNRIKIVFKDCVHASDREKTRHIDIRYSKSSGVYSISSAETKDVYDNGYILNDKIALLTSDASSDIISEAIGGTSGMHKIMDAIKDGNLLRLLWTLGDGSTFSVNLNGAYDVKGSVESVAFTGMMYGLWGGLLFASCIITYNGDTNEFSISIEHN